jgi:hypothetical protein
LEALLAAEEQIEADGGWLALDHDGPWRGILERYYEGKPPERVAEGEECGPSEVKRVRRQAGLDPEYGRPETDLRVLDMLKMHRQGTSIRELAGRTGVSKSTIARALKGQQDLPAKARSPRVAPRSYAP